MRFALILSLMLSFISQQAYAAEAKAEIKGTAPGSTLSGTADFKDTPTGLEVTVNVSGAPAGPHGLHVHENGSCADAGNAAGGHYNPDGVKHGFIMQDGTRGAHPGDFGNIEVGADGKGTLKLVVPDLTIKEGKYQVSSHAVVMHEKLDDMSQPTGNAGSRIGCGVIETGK